MNRRSLLTVVLATFTVAASLLVAPKLASASVAAKLDFSQDGTFWRLQQRNPIVDVPCQPPIPADRCGQVAPTAGVVNAPNVLDGNMVVGFSGGQPGADKGDQFWIVSQPDLSSLGPIESVEKLILTYTVAPDARGDFGSPVIKGCNIVVPFGVGEGSNPWDDRPAIDCNSAKVPVIKGNIVTFDVTSMAKSWADGTGFGLAIVPGLPGASAVVGDPARRAETFPFQISFINSNKADANRNPVPGRAKAEIEYTPAAEEDFGDGGGDDFGLAVDDFSTDETGLGDVDAFESSGSGDEFASGGLDDAPTSVKSAGTSRPGARLVGSSRPGFSWGLLLLLPLLILAVWGAGSALGPLGDPVPVRQGGVGRLVARRRAARIER